MNPPRRLAILSFEEMLRLTEARLLLYRKKALSLENCPDDSDYSPSEIEGLDMNYIWFKSDPRWMTLYHQIRRALAKVQSPK